VSPAKDAGITLAEVLLSMLLLALSVLAIAPLFVEALEGTAASADLGVAGAYGVDRMERLRALPYGALVPGGDLTADVAGYFEAPAPDYVVRWQIADNAALVPGTKVVTVRALSSRAMRGPRREIVLTTLRGD
jgi:hypothetical protein